MTWRSGYYADHRYPTRRGVVHAMRAGEPLCGTRPGSQFCGTNSEVECKACLRIQDSTNCKEGGNWHRVVSTNSGPFRCQDCPFVMHPEQARPSVLASRGR